MLGRSSAALTLLLFAACARDTSLPDPPGPGSVTGRVLLARPGETEKRALPSVEVRLLGSGQATTTSPAGTFTLPNIEVKSGLLLFRIELDGELRQRVVQLAEFGTGPNLQVNLGDIVMGANATVRGNVLRGDIATRGGHGGTTLFVPAGPFTAFTNDDGSYVIEQMPEGPVELYAFRSGYAPQSLGGITLRSGEVLTLQDVVLEISTSTSPGSVTGSLGFVPEAAGQGDARVRLVSTEGDTVEATVAADNTFTAPSVPVGLYRLSASRTGYSLLEVINVLVVSGVEAKVGVLTLTTAPPFDAGTYPSYDASVPFDAGTDDAGIDAGTDAGMGPGFCSQQADCMVGQWCDPQFSRCVPRCVGDLECGFGRMCEQATRTCVTSCAGTCPAGQICSAQNVCQAVCTGAFPCPSGKRCALGMCVNECDPAIPTSCNSPFLTCDLGACKRNAYCTGDLDCEREQMCVIDQCGARPTDAGVQPDGGRWLDGGLSFACSSPCECRLGEQCADGFCVSDLIPTRYVSLDGGGNGRTANTPSGLLYVGTTGILPLRSSEDAGPGGIVALRSEDSWALGPRTLQLLDGAELAGGFTDCRDGRWLRDRSHRTTLAGDGNPEGLVLIESTLATPFTRGSVSGLSLSLTGIRACTSAGAAMTVKTTGTARVDGVSLRDLDVTVALGNCSATIAGLRTTGMRNGKIERFRLNGLGGVGTTGGHGLSFTASSATVEDVSLAPATLGVAVGIKVDNATEPFVLRRVQLDQWRGGNSAMRGLELLSSTAPITLEDANIKFFASNLAGSHGFAGVYASNVPQLTLRRVLIDGTGHPGPVANTTNGFELANSRGTLSDLTVRFPRNTQAALNMTGVLLSGAGGYDIQNLTISGQDIATGNPLKGIHFSGLTGAPTVVRDSTLAFSGLRTIGVHSENSGIAVDLAVIDSRIDVRGEGSCGTDARGIVMDNVGALISQLRAERVQIVASNSALVVGTHVAGDSLLELYASTIRLLGSYGQSGLCQSGVTSLNEGGTVGVLLTDAARLNARANTIDSGGSLGQPGQSTAMICRSASAQVLGFDSNVLTAGNGTPSRFFYGQPGVAVPLCTRPPNARSNFFFRYPTANQNPEQNEQLFDGGMLGGNGNSYGTTSCFAASAGLPDGGLTNPFIPVAAPCLNSGLITQRRDGSPILLDALGQARDAGGLPDIGAIEGP